MYSKKAIEYFRKPKFNKEIKDADGIGEVGNINCGDVLKIFIKVKNGKINNIGYNAYGCLAAIASSESLCRLAKGKKIEDALKLEKSNILKDLGQVPTSKIHCSILATEALIEAIYDYYNKNKMDFPDGLLHKHNLVKKMNESFEKKHHVHIS